MERVASRWVEGYRPAATRAAAAESAPQLCGFCLERSPAAAGKQAAICRPCAVQVVRALIGG